MQRADDRFIKDVRKGGGCRVTLEYGEGVDAGGRAEVESAVATVMEKNQYSVAFGYEGLPEDDQEDDDNDDEEVDMDEDGDEGLNGDPGMMDKTPVAERAKFIPLRLR